MTPPHRGKARPSPRWLRRLPSYLLVGAVSTAAYWLMYVALRGVVGALWANAIALVLSTLGDTAGKRRVTFRVRGRRTVVPHQALGLLLLGVALLVTTGSLHVLQQTSPAASLAAELVVLGVANLAVGVLRFVAFTVVMEPRSAQAEADA